MEFATDDRDGCFVIDSDDEQAQGDEDGVNSLASEAV